MKYYLISAALIFLAVLVILLIPSLTNFSEKVLTISEVIVPNKSEVAGVQRFVYPPSFKGLPAPDLTARAILIKDLDSGSILYSKEASERLPIASTTKIMTALVASSYFQPNSVLVASSSAFIGGSKVGLLPGEKLTFRSLLFGMLLNSGNDAAFCIGENYPGGVNGFVAAMNKKALELGLTNTHFDNPAGFDSPSHYSSASDLSQITEEALKNPDLTKVFATKQTEIFSIDKKISHNLVNLNILLTKLKGVLGVKTGYTDIAKENFVGLVNRDGHRILTVVLGSDDRFGETSQLVEWTYSSFTWQ